MGAAAPDEEPDEVTSIAAWYSDVDVDGAGAAPGQKPIARRELPLVTRTACTDALFTVRISGPLNWIAWRLWWNRSTE
jgi:hypothetical protein